MPDIAPSILSADFARLGEELEALDAAGCRIVHLDVMDGLFVPNLTFGAPVIRALRPYTGMVFDVHLMIDEPARYFDDFVKAGADMITIHYEATVNAPADLAALRRLGVKAGLSIKPSTGVEKVEHLLGLCDLVLVMSVEPGFGGQSFQPQALQKLERLAALRHERGYTYLIEVDGGINLDNIGTVAQAGAQLIVTGSAFFGAQDYTAQTACFYKAMEQAGEAADENAK